MLTDEDSTKDKKWEGGRSSELECGEKGKNQKEWEVSEKEGRKAKNWRSKKRREAMRNEKKCRVTTKLSRNIKKGDRMKGKEVSKGRRGDVTERSELSLAGIRRTEQ
jgi:hypothetical protein